MAKSKALICFCLAFISGIFLDSFVSIPPSTMMGFFIFGILLLFWTFWKYHRSHCAHKDFIVISLCLLFFVVGIWRHQLSLAEINNNWLKNYNDSGQIVILEGTIIEEPTVKSNYLKIIAAVNRINGLWENHEKIGKVLITTERYPEYHYGDQIRIRGKLESPPIFEGFNYQNYLAKEGIYSIISWPEIEVAGENKGNPLYKLLFSLKNKLKESLNKVMAPPKSAILEALLFGDEENVSQEWKEKFNLTGTRHITAVSGMNITIITFLIFNFLLALGLWRNQAFYFALILVILYILMIGAPASALRAGIMAGLFLIAQYFGRVSAASRAIVIAATLMLLQNPRLALDVGFALSSLATLGLIYLQSFFLNLFKKVPDIFQLRSTLSATLSAQIFTLPILIYNFGRIPVLSPLANILIVPLLPLITILGFIFSFLGIISPFLGQILSWPVWILLTYLVGVIDLFSKIPFVSLVAVDISWIWFLAFYLLLWYFVWRLDKKQKEKFLNY